MRAVVIIVLTDIDLDAVDEVEAGCGNLVERRGSQFVRRKRNFGQKMIPN